MARLSRRAVVASHWPSPGLGWWPLARGFGYPHLLGTVAFVVGNGKIVHRRPPCTRCRTEDGSAEGVAGWPDRCLGSRRRAV